jgi:hypothetical protein
MVHCTHDQSKRLGLSYKCADKISGFLQRSLAELAPVTASLPNRRFLCRDIVRPCISLGYADDDANAAVKASIDAGSMTTLNAPAEVELAETLLLLAAYEMAKAAV